MERADLRKYQRHSEVAELVLGEDAPLLGEICCSKPETKKKCLKPGSCQSTETGSTSGTRRWRSWRWGRTPPLLGEIISFAMTETKYCLKM